jgi:hypothetical protein
MSTTTETSDCEFCLLLLPPELLCTILDASTGPTFIRLWQCGDSNLNLRLRQCKTVSLCWDGALPALWPSSIFQYAPIMESFCIRYLPSVPDTFPVDVISLQTLPKHLKSLSLLRISNAHLSGFNLGAQCPSLIFLSLDCHSTVLSTFDPLAWNLPIGMTTLRLDMNCEAKIHLLPLLTSLPNLIELYCVGITWNYASNIEPKPITWPENLTQLKLNIATEHPLTIFSSLPSSLIHLCLFMHLPEWGTPSNTDFLQRQFPWSSLPASLKSFSFFGWSDPPESPNMLPAGLEVFCLHRRNFLGMMPKQSSSITREYLHNFWKKTSPKMNTCNIACFSTMYSLNYTADELSSQLIPPSITSVSIAPTPIYYQIPLLPKNIIHLEISLAQPKVYEDFTFICPPSLRYIYINSDDPLGYVLAWTLPDGLIELIAPKSIFPHERGAIKLPRGLKKLCCSQLAFPKHSSLSDLPQSITKFEITILPSRQSIAPEWRPHHVNFIQTSSSATLLPPQLNELILTIPELYSTTEYEVSYWLQGLPKTMPLEKLYITQSAQLSSGKFLRLLPPSLTQLECPVAEFGGPHFRLLPRRLHTLHINSLDFTYMDTKMEHLDDLPKGITKLIMDVHGTNIRKSHVLERLRYLSKSSLTLNRK